MAAGEAEIHRSLLGESLQENVLHSKVLVVGAGGIGCELLKNLVLTGFRDIHLIDLDTIDVSNLNRQFLFQKKHVGKSKAKVARESILAFKPGVDITAYHDNITNPEYTTDFFKKFTLVMNALDNRAARNHVNRMCLAADIPLVESGTAGYLGQVTVIKKGLTECYECQPKPTQKTYPGCTIRNTPSEPIHCIVWAKHLFSQLFGEADADEEVSPDTEDPELAENAGKMAAQKLAEDANNEIKRVSTRDWAQEAHYDHNKLFNKFFCNDIKYLLSMDKLWKKRRAPVPLTSDEAWSQSNESAVVEDNSGLRDKRLWSISECAKVFKRSVEDLRTRFENCKDFLVWDKDDKDSMDFVAATANIRSHIFGIVTKSRFDVKSMAGNIIPAIATTNAVISGLIVMEALKILSGNIQRCRTVYLNKQPKVKKRLLMPSALVQPNPKCYVCASKPEVTVHLDVDSVTVKILEEKILKERFNMVAPDVEIDDGKGTILLSSEEGETEDNYPKCLSEFKIGNGTRLKADDFLQNYILVINIRQSTTLDPSEIFIVEGETPMPVPEEKAAVSQSSPEATAADGPNEDEIDSHGDDIEIVEEMNMQSTTRKRKLEDEYVEMETKKAKVNDDDDIIIL